LSSREAIQKKYGKITMKVSNQDSLLSALIHSKVAKRIKFSPKQRLILQGEKLQYVYFVISGCIKVYVLNVSGEEITLALRGPNEIVGLHTFLTNDIHKSTAEAIEEAEVLRVKKNDFNKLVAQSHKLTLSLLHYLAFQSRQEQKYITRLVTDDLESRTWKTIRRIAKFSPNNTCNISQEDLAQIIGATRARITETLHTLEKKHYIQLGRKKIAISHH
jgi:CRP/FNR family transcriptional regulator, cyclic AMP receptor protein